MHELAICRAILAQVEELAVQRRASVHSITLRIGPLSGVEAELLRRAYPLASAGSRSDGAQLHIESSPVRVRCRHCEQESEVKANRLLCAHCGEWRTQLVSGDELLLARVELEPDVRIALTERAADEYSAAH